MHLFPPVAYSPKAFRNGPVRVQVFYHWDSEALKALRLAVAETSLEFSEWYRKVDEPVVRLLDRVEFHHEDGKVEVHRLPTDFEGRFAWFDQHWPSRVFGEVVGAMISGAYDEVLLGKS